MIREGIDRIVELATPPIVTSQAGVEYWAATGKPVLRPRPDALQLTGLDALVTYLLSAEVPDGVLVAVHNVDSVLVARMTTPDAIDRRVFAVATPAARTDFSFDCYQPLETVLCSLQAQFIQTPERDDLLRLLSKVDTTQSSVSEDDGIAQRLTVKAGVQLSTTASVKNPVMLRPFRTFQELDQPASPFILRVRDRDKSVGLFEADGGTWRIDCFDAIRSYLRAGLTGCAKEVVVL